MTALNLFIGWQVLCFVALIILAILSWVYYDKRYKKNNISKVPSGYIWTDEISIDPTTGKKERVYYNPDTGDRFYKQE
ncbi:hypothetical protein [Fictibacillus barbaricus]|uniref:HD family phosphohydrolase n=1 Tax=Fictibacillus barbaricus TaxID=182136 RepID=A0ABU1TVQ6_9BACL|nr:hypothetical protein [Fictibacillus barbaricus]MDR7071296.1 hypothetical protein [Fictibacillus barbaricus]